jgi:acyl-CoA reductase-like NAD-dependent aldehyde dehydrogenase
MGGDSASALAAGCAVVHKGHPDHPRLAQRTADVVIRSLERSGAPEGLFALVSDVNAGVPLVEHKTVRAVGFTGSTAGGRALFDRAAARPDPIPFFGELGSTNPVFVTEAAWMARSEEIVRGYVGSATLGMGQFCTKPGFLVVPDVDESVEATLRGAVESVPRFPMLSERLSEGFIRTVQQFVHDASAAELAKQADDNGAAPVFLEVSGDDVLADPALLHTEMFGPASVVVREADPGKREAIASALSGQLTVTLWAEPDDDIVDLVRILERKAGRILYNDWPTGVSVSYAQQHGGPYPASTASGTTSVGTAAIRRFMRPVAYQQLPQDVLPDALRDDNPLGIRRRVDGEWDAV